MLFSLLKNPRLLLIAAYFRAFWLEGICPFIFFAISPAISSNLSLKVSVFPSSFKKSPKIGIPPKRLDNWNSPYADLDSVFYHMNEELLMEYEQKGISKENFLSLETVEHPTCFPCPAEIHSKQKIDFRERLFFQTN